MRVHKDNRIIRVVRMILCEVYIVDHHNLYNKFKNI